MILNISDRFTNSCEDTRLVGELYKDSQLENVLRYTLVGVLSIEFPFSILLNGFSIFLILRFKHLHHSTFFLILQLLLVDLFDAMFFTPVAIVNALAGKWIMVLPFCTFTGGVSSFNSSIRHLLMFVIVCDRFGTIFKPFNYQRIRWKVITILSISASMLTVISAIIVVGLDCMKLDKIAWYCVPQEGCKNPHSCRAVLATFGPVPYVIGSYIPLVMYIVLFIKARKLKNRVSSSDQQLSEEFQLRKKNERKASVTFFLIFLALFGVSAIPFIFYVTVSLLYSNETPTAVIIPNYIFRLLYSFLPIIDPVAIMRNQEVRKAWRMLRNRNMVTPSLN